MTSDAGGELLAERTLVARACRILAHRRVVDTVLGHVSLRVDDDHFLVRCRGPEERGLRFSVATDIRLVDLEGRFVGDSGGYSVPNELPIHSETLRLRPELSAVVHAHPPAVVACAVAGLELRPIIGAFNIPAMRMAASGIPVYPRSVLIRRPELAAEMLAAMGAGRWCVLSGHGVTVGGASLEEAVVGAIDLESLAAVTLAVASTGREAPIVPREDMAELPDLGSELNLRSMWRHYAAAAEADGF